VANVNVKTANVTLVNVAGKKMAKKSSFKDKKALLARLGKPELTYVKNQRDLDNLLGTVTSSKVYANGGGTRLVRS